MNTQAINAMWESRPTRIPSSQGGNAKVAGVCEGIGVRYQVDPTLIRILFVAAGLVGGGLGVYLVAWLIMPRYSMELSPIEAVLKNSGEEYQHEKNTGWWLLAALIVFGFSATSGSGDLVSGSTLVSLALAFAVWYYLHSKQPETPTTPYADVGPAEGFQTPTPPAWDPLGAVPALWDLPEPGPAPAPAPKKKSHGWLWIGGAIAVLALVTAVTNTDFHTSASNLTSVVSNESQLQDTYENGIGNLTLDLSDLAPLTENRTVQVDSGIGNVEIRLPKEVPTKLECETGLGDSNCTPGLHNEGPGKVLTIKIDSGIGQVTVD
ncbi:PspC domain-containing protein [Corynebacterium sp. H128]|uniref:PspC domain-containing protein n=1 Tax=unclassified Corynebacterium TaxID=2624378 RepID=UPI00309FE8F0